MLLLKSKWVNKDKSHYIDKQPAVLVFAQVIMHTGVRLNSTAHKALGAEVRRMSGLVNRLEVTVRRTES